MFMGGDCNLNSSQVHTDSFKEILRQTMLNQEMIFRKQVFVQSALLNIMATTNLPSPEELQITFLKTMTFEDGLNF